MKRVTYTHILAKTDPENHAALDALWSSSDTDALVLFVNENMDSSQFGATSILAIGSSRTYKTIAEVDGKYINDLPSQRQYPYEYCAKEGV